MRSPRELTHVTHDLGLVLLFDYLLFAHEAAELGQHGIEFGGLFLDFAASFGSDAFVRSVLAGQAVALAFHQLNLFRKTRPRQRRGRVDVETGEQNPSFLAMLYITKEETGASLEAEWAENGVQITTHECVCLRSRWSTQRTSAEERSCASAGHELPHKDGRRQSAVATAGAVVAGAVAGRARMLATRGKIECKRQMAATEHDETKNTAWGESRTMCVESRWRFGRRGCCRSQHGRFGRRKCCGARRRHFGGG